MGHGKEALTLVNYEGTFTFDRKELERLMAAQPNAPASRTVREFLDLAKNLKFQFILNANQTGFELIAKSNDARGTSPPWPWTLEAAPASARRFGTGGRPSGRGSTGTWPGRRPWPPW